VALSVIGAGYGRTGTLSLKAALEQLGYLKCHHMIEVLRSPEQIEAWMAAARGDPMNWDALFSGYLASVDWPSCHFYRELAAHYPQARVVLTVRDPREWYESMNATTLRVIRRSMAEHPDRPSLGTELVVNGAFGGDIDSAAHAIEIFEAHTAEVIAAIPAERLLVFDVREGWEPLCNFLQRDVPAAAFPRVNSREEFDGIFFGDHAD
jgi:hypothetical protein